MFGSSRRMRRVVDSAILLAYFSSAASTLAWSVLFYMLALFFNYPHYMATIYRAYHTKEDFEKYRIFTVHITLLLALTIVLSHFWIRALPWIFTVYLSASPWHYSGQNYGLFMMFARRAGAQPPHTRAPRPLRGISDLVCSFAAEPSHWKF